MTDKNIKPTPDDSDAWIADLDNPGDSITGKVVEVDTAWSDWRARQSPRDPNGGFYPLIRLELEDGTIKTVHGFRTVLYNELLKRKPVTGEVVTVTFVGKGKDKGDGSNPPLVFRVNVHDRGPDADKDVYSSLPGGGRPQAPVGEPDDEPPIPF